MDMAAEWILNYGQKNLVDYSNKGEEPKYLTQTLTKWNNNMNGKEQCKTKKTEQKK